MRTLLHCLLVSVWLVQAFVPRSDLHQLVHWPDLVAHYEAHQSQGQHAYADFWEFLAAHYLEIDGHPHPEHDNLPLYHSHSPTYCLPLLRWRLCFPTAEAASAFISRPGPRAAVGYPHTDPRPPQKA